MKSEADSAERPADKLTEEVEQLVWTMLDETIEPADLQRLEGLLEQEPAARERYLECMRMHSDLLLHFQEQREGAPLSDKQSPVLGFLGDLRPGSDSLPPVQE